MDASARAERRRKRLLENADNRLQKIFSGTEATLTSQEIQKSRSVGGGRIYSVNENELPVNESSSHYQHTSRTNSEIKEQKYNVNGHYKTVALLLFSLVSFTLVEKYMKQPVGKFYFPEAIFFGIETIWLIANGMPSNKNWVIAFLTSFTPISQVYTFYITKAITLFHETLQDWLFFIFVYVICFLIL